MALSQEQAKYIREQFIKQIEATFPPEQKATAIEEVSSMSNEELEEFVMKNNALARENSTSSNSEEKIDCIFCAIVEGKVNSYKLDENKDNIAILEINPLSKGHSIIIPKKHVSSVDKIKPSALTLAKKVASKIKEKLKPEDVKIENSTVMGHVIINVIPLYKDVPLKKQKASEKELGELWVLLKVKPKKKREPRVKRTAEEKKDSQKEYPVYKKRIP